METKTRGNRLPGVLEPKVTAMLVSHGSIGLLRQVGRAVYAPPFSQQGKSVHVTVYLLNA